MEQKLSEMIKEISCTIEHRKLISSCRTGVEHQIKCTKKIKLNAKRNIVKFNSIQFI